jgi:hypothetical protein
MIQVRAPSYQKSPLKHKAYLHSSSHRFGTLNTCTTSISRTSHLVSAKDMVFLLMPSHFLST